MKNVWGINKIREILPQDYPFLFIDRVLEIDKDKKTVKCLKNLTINESFFSGHFPGNPIAPGVIVIEAMAQASIILFAAVKPDIAKKSPDYYLGKVEVKFLKPAKVGDQLILEVRGIKLMSGSGVVEASASVDDEVVAQGRLFFGVKVKSECGIGYLVYSLDSSLKPFLSSRSKA